MSSLSCIEMTELHGTWIQPRCQRPPRGTNASERPCQPVQRGGGSRVRRGRNISRFAWATQWCRVIIAMASCCAVIGGRADAQVPLADSGQPAVVAKETSPPAADEAMRTFQRVDAALRLFDASKLSDLRERTGRYVASAVTLRYEGRAIGRGTDIGDHGATVERAFAAALAEAKKRLPQTPDAFGASQVSLFAPDLVLSVELSGDLVPIVPATFGQLDLEILRGLEGVAARFGDAAYAVFPAAILVNATAPSDAMVACVSGASGDPTLSVRNDPKGQPGALATERHAVFYKFPVVHLAQQGKGQPPEFLFRGGKVVGDREVTVASMRRFADELADWLVRWDTSHREEPDWPRGTYLPTRNIFDPQVASLAEYAVVSYAIHRFIEVKSRFQSDSDRWAWVRPGAAATASVRFGPRRLAAAPLADQTAGPVYGCLRAFVAMAPLMHGPLTELPEELVNCEADLAAVYTAEKGWNEQVPEPARAFLAFVLARRATLIKGEADSSRRIEAARGAIQSLYRDTKPSMLVMHMPWLGWADLMLSGDQPVGAEAALRDMRDLVWKFQMNASDAGTEGPDLVGGIVFTSSSDLLPTSQSLRPLAFLATMLGDRRLTDASERPRQLSKMLGALRFVRQLAMDEHSMFCAVDPGMAKMGIRACAWDFRQSPEASALGLLTVCGALESIADMADQPRGNP